MPSPFLRNLTPSLKFAFFLLLMMAGLSIMGLIGSELITFIFGYNILEDGAVIMEYDQPYVVEANKILIFCHELGMFLLPSIAFAYFVAFHVRSYLMLMVPPSFKFLLLGIALFGFSLPLIEYLGVLNEALTLPPFLSGVEEWLLAQENTNQKFIDAVLNDSSFWAYLMNIVIIALVPAFAEELAFRGVIQKLFARWQNSIHFGIWSASVFFAILHFQVYSFIPVVLFGAMMGYLLKWSGSIWVPIFVHFLNNTVSITASFLSQRSRTEADWPFSFDEIWKGQLGFMDAILIVISILLVWVTINRLKRHSRWPVVRRTYFID